MKMTMMMRNQLYCCLWLLVCLQGSAFAPNPLGSQLSSSSSTRLSTTTTDSSSSSSSSDSRRMGELTSPEQKVYDFMESIHDSGYNFRMVVVGKGAILETTAALGPVLKVTQSPSTGANLMTLATEDQSFEFHLQLSQVSKIVLAEKTTPVKTLRIIRLLNAEGESMSSLILADESAEAVTWYEALIVKYGKEIQL